MGFSRAESMHLPFARGVCELPLRGGFARLPPHMNRVLSTSDSTRREFIRLSTGAGGAFALGLSPLARAASAKGRAKGNALPHSTPAEAGIEDRHIVNFVQEMGREGHELHSLMILRHGKVVAEGWAAPYERQFNHAMYSLSKSFTSTAVGFAVAEGLLNVTDKVVGFFPDRAPAKIGERLARLNVEHLLTMSAGMARTATGNTVKERDWVKAFLAQPIEHEPGTVFNYNTAATYMLSAIVQKVSGQGLIDFLKPRLFERIGITGATWDECPMGVAKGGFGLNINTEGLARMGQLYLQKGRWKGRQILPESWIEAATSKHIQQGEDSNKNPDWRQGYGYQFWRCRHNCYRGDGAFGQFIVVMPEKDAVVVMTSESKSMQGELDLVWKHLLPNFGQAAAPATGWKTAPAAARMREMRIPFPAGSQEFVESAGILRGRKIRFPKNETGVDMLTVKQTADVLDLDFGSAEYGDWSLRSGWHQWSRAAMPMLTAKSWLVSRGNTDKRGRSKVTVSHAWEDANTLNIVLRYHETPHHDILAVRFEESGATLEITDSISRRRNAKAKPRFTSKGNFVS